MGIAAMSASEHRSACEVDRTRRPGEERHHADDRRRQRVNDALALGRPLTGDDRKHRYPRPRVIARDDLRERPEMRRRPEEDHAEEGKRRGVEAAGRGGPTHQWGYRSGGAADDDVMRRRTLEPDGVNEDVDERARERE